MTEAAGTDDGGAINPVDPNVPTDDPTPTDDTPTTTPENVTQALALIDQELAFGFVIGCAIFAILWGLVNTWLVSILNFNVLSR